MARNKGILATLAAVAATLAWTTAYALPPDEAVDADAAVVSGPASVAPAVGIVGGTGGFSFGSTSCVMASASGTVAEGGETTPDVDVTATACSASAVGSYLNIVCGTGIALGTGTLTEGGGSDSYTVQNFGVLFVAGVGYLSGQATESEADGGGAAGAQPVYGVVVLVPLLPPPSQGCVVQFTATAVLLTSA
jgi:hypothetical protein